jgi:hypothetical protein
MMKNMFNEDVARNSGVTRVVAVVLTEAEWRALRAVEPKPADWLQKVVHDRLKAGTDADSHAQPYELLNAAASERLAG